MIFRKRKSRSLRWNRWSLLRKIAYCSIYFSGHNNFLLVLKQWKGALNLPARSALRARSLGTLRSNDATATRTSLKKVCLRSFSLYSDYSYKNFVKCRRTLLKLNFKGPYPSSEREIKFRRCLFTSSIKHEIRHFHVVVVQKRERNVQKKCDARAKLLFCL